MRSTTPLSSHNIRNFDAQKTREFGVGNARISWTSADGRWDGTVFVNNFTDARIRLNRFRRVEPVRVVLPIPMASRAGWELRYGITINDSGGRAP